MESPTPDQSHLNLISDYTEEQELPAEAYVISALMQEGQYTPEAHGLTNEHFMAFKQTHEFLRLYQQQAKAAPPLRLLLDKFPRFPYVPGVSAVWAAKQLHQEHQERHLRKTLAKVGMLVSEGRIDAAGDLMRAASRVTAAPGTMTSVSAYDPIPDETDPKVVVPVLEGTMAKFCRGISPGHLWYVAGIPGMGKTYRLIEHALLAAEAGWDVAFFSLEMPAKEIQDRVQKMITGHPDDMGAIQIYTGSVSAADIGSVASDGTLIIIDYVSKLRGSDGTRSITDYRLAAAISGELKDVAMTCNVPILSAVQFNRSAYEAKNVNMGHTADTDAYNKDADVMIGMKRVSESVILNTIMKNRHDVSGRKFYTRFTPGSARAMELSFDEANEAIFEDTEKSITH